MENYKILETVPELDFDIFERQDLEFLSPASHREIKFKHIRNSFANHYRTNEMYRKYCSNMGIQSDEIYNIDINKIPLLPSSLFKKMPILSVPISEVEKVCTSSGTLGSVSRIYRDSSTMFRFLGSVQYSTRNNLQLDDAHVFNLGPDMEEAKDLWFSYVMSILNLLYPTENYVVNNHFLIHNLVQDISQVLASNKSSGKLVLVGPPILFMNLFEYLKTNDIKINLKEKGMIITAGGWKKFSGQSISKSEFNETAMELLGLTSFSSIRDALNLVELNTVLIECEYQKKHISPWLHVSIKSPYTLEELPSCEEGVIAYYDPTSESYPGFILSDDFGIIRNGCPCGRLSDHLELTRRIRTIESRGCSLKIDRSINEDQMSTT